MSNIVYFIKDHAHIVISKLFIVESQRCCQYTLNNVFFHNTKRLIKIRMTYIFILIQDLNLLEIVVFHCKTIWLCVFRQIVVQYNHSRGAIERNVSVDVLDVWGYLFCSKMEFFCVDNSADLTRFHFLWKSDRTDCVCFILK